MTAAEFSSELNSWATSQGQFPTLSPGDTVVVTGRITGISGGNFSSDSFVTLDESALLFPVNLPGACDMGDQMTLTLHIITFSFQGQTAEWIQELGTGSSGIAFPASAVTCP